MRAARNPSAVDLVEGLRSVPQPYDVTDSRCPMRCATMLIVLLTCPAIASTELAIAALERTHATVVYDGSYRAIDYPNGDVPAHTGVCSDVVVRSYRALGIDLQRLVHEDMSRSFSTYPAIWGLRRPDRNIDHRRVPNLETFFRRHGRDIPISSRGRDYQPGDIVTWRLDGRLPHIGIVGPRRVAGTDRFYVIHNVGQGPKEEDALFRYPIQGHYRYGP